MKTGKASGVGAVLIEGEIWKVTLESSERGEEGTWRVLANSASHAEAKARTLLFREIVTDSVTTKKDANRIFKSGIRATLLEMLFTVDG